MIFVSQWLSNEALPETKKKMSSQENNSGQSVVSQMIKTFGLNALRCKKLGWSIQKIANSNKMIAMNEYNLDSDVAELVVTRWVDACIESGVFQDNSK